MLHLCTESRMVNVEKRRENTSQIASSACLRSSPSIGHYYVNVWRKNKVANSGKKMSHLQTKIGDTNLRTLSQWTQKGDKEFYNRHFIYRKKRLGLQRNLIFNQGIKNIWVFEVVVVGWRGRESRKLYVPLEKSWLRPWLERIWSIDSLFQLGSSHVVFLSSLIHEVKDNMSLYKIKNWSSSWTIFFGKIRLLMLEKSRDFVES